MSMIAEITEYRGWQIFAALTAKVGTIRPSKWFATKVGDEVTCEAPSYNSLLAMIDIRESTRITYEMDTDAVEFYSGVAAEKLLKELHTEPGAFYLKAEAKIDDPKTLEALKGLADNKHLSFGFDEE